MWSPYTYTSFTLNVFVHNARIYIRDNRFKSYFTNFRSINALSSTFYNIATGSVFLAHLIHQSGVLLLSKVRNLVSFGSRSGADQEQIRSGSGVDPILSL